MIFTVGPYRDKSWFVNVLRGHHNGFKLGEEVEGCTRGIYMWDSAFKLEPDGEIIQKRVIVLNTEGIDDPKQDQNWETKLFVLCFHFFGLYL